MSEFKVAVSLLDYGAGNVRSLRYDADCIKINSLYICHVCRNAIKVLGFEVIDIVNPEDIDAAKMIIFPGVGSFGQAIKVLFLTQKSYH